ncbi:mitochondrial carrier domain-containing protein [Lipomyces oligophaga]|uniref:mitochondrial carrier domain-containing protein n=1 Tax=Lipomyces oligophaga TaxID=45792 RepID=UPI0034D00EB2
MATSDLGSPLRPYYHRPELVFHDGVPDLAISKSGASGTAASFPSGYSRVVGGTSTSTGLRRDAILADLDYADYLEFPNTTEMIRNVTNAALMRYSSTFLAQPFEVAKMVLQCAKYPRPNGSGISLGGTNLHPDGSGALIKKPKKRGRHGRLDDIDTFEIDLEAAALDDEEIDYFSTPDAATESSTPARASPAPVIALMKEKKRGGSMSSDGSSGGSRRTTRPRPITASPGPDSYQINGHRPYILGSMGALWNKDGPWGIWKGTNITFLESLLMSTLDSWLSGFLSAVLGISDPNLIDIIDSGHPLLSLFTSIAATTLATLIVSPLDIVRTKLILTPPDAQPRSIIASLQCLPSFTCPQPLLLPTALFAAIPRTISRGTPYFLRQQWGIEQYTSPGSYRLLTFVSSSIELFVRLPLETVLRRGQLAYVGVQRTVVDIGSYTGVLGTIWDILRNEDNGESGLEGIWRGWRVGMVGIVGTWGINLFRSKSLDYGREERF